MLLEGSFNYPVAARLQPEAQKPTQKLFKKSASERTNERVRRAANYPFIYVVCVGSPLNAAAFVIKILFFF